MGETNIVHKLHDALHKWEAQGVVLSQQTWSNYSDNISLRLSQCENCGFGIYLPIVVGNDSFYSEISQNEYYLSDRWDFQMALKTLQSTKAHSVLDVGCGRGAFLQQVLNHLPLIDCHGFDANPTIGEYLPISVTLHSNMIDAPSNFDAVTLFQVLEHVDDPLLLLQQSIAKVRLGGLVIVSVPDHTGPIRFFSDSHTEIPPHHVSIWTPKSLNYLLTRLELDILTSRVERLPDYLMPFYLPKIIVHKLGYFGMLLQEKRIKKFIANPITILCNMLNIKYLPCRGHTYFVIAMKNGNS